MSARSIGGKNNSLNKKIPENPRYKHVKSIVDTGASVTKYLEHLDEIKKNYKYRNDEIFRRIKATTFVQLVLQIASVNISERELLEEHPYPSDDVYTSSPLPLPQSRPSPPSTARSTLSELVTGVGELGISNPEISPLSTPLHTPSPSHSTPSQVLPQSPYLLLDVREKEDYDKCHIITARSYPSHMLSRSCNPYTREIFEYKNKPGCIIVVYDEDETIAHGVATKMVQRDFDNIFILSGGMRILFRTFPDGLLTGKVPNSCYPSPSSSVSSGRRKTPRSNGPHHRITETVDAREEIKDYFTLEDLLSLQRKLDEVLLTSSCSSRGSTSGSRSMTSSSRLSSVSRRTDTSRIWKY